MQHTLKVENLYKRIGKKELLRDISLDLRGGGYMALREKTVPEKRCYSEP